MRSLEAAGGGSTPTDKSDSEVFSCHKLIYLHNDKVLYEKSKPCHLVLDSKTIVPIDDFKNREYEYKYIYKIVPDAEKRFAKVSKYEQWINSNILIDDTIIDFKSE